MLVGKMMIPQGKSGLSFKEGVLIRVEYYANLRNENKNKSGKYKGEKWVDHMTIPCFTTKVRTDDLKAMDNYTTKKPSYIYNIKNNDDDLCFIRYIIVIEFLSVEQHTPYLLYRETNKKCVVYKTLYNSITMHICYLYNI